MLEAPLQNLPSTSDNPWPTGSILLALLIFGIGYAWSGLLPRSNSSSHRIIKPLLSIAHMIAAGLPILLLANFVLAQIGLFASPWVLSTWLVLFLLGCLLTVRTKNAFPPVWQGVTAVLLFTLLFAGAMLIPGQAEWVAGGWDPGVYVNNGMHIARTGSAHAEPLHPFEALTDQELDLFTLHFDDQREAFPGIPVSPEDRSLQMYFFPLTPTAIATWAHDLGMRGAVRINLFLCILMLPVFWGFLMRLTRNPFLSSVAAIFLLVNPVLLYHINIPTSEILQLFLLCCIGFFLASQSTEPVHILFAALAILAALLNRLAFLPFAAVLVAIVIWIDENREPFRRRCRRYAPLWIAVALGLLLNLAAARVTIQRLQFVIILLSAAALAVFIASLVLDRIAATDAGGKWKERYGNVIEVFAGSALLLFALGLGMPFAPEPLARASFNLRMLIPYLGPAMVIAAVGGFGFVIFAPKTGIKNLRWPLYFLLLCGLGLVVQRFAANLRPWVTRRSLDYLVPFCAITAAVLVNHLVLPDGFARKYPGLPRRLPGIAIGILVLAFTLPKGVRGFQAKDYVGLSHALARVAEAAPEPSSGPVIVADHFVWGTPLAMTYGLPVLNGERIWQSDEACEAGFKALARLHQAGHAIFFFTSTEKGYEVFPARQGTFSLHYDGGPVSFRQVLHKPEFTDFKTIPKTKHFRLYQWEPGDE